jgi:acyl-homoserine lactone acylase PvdQ
MSNFVDGVNAAVDNRIIFPLEFYLTGIKWEPWQISDMYLIFKMMDWGTTFSIFDESLYGLLSGVKNQ